MIESTTVRIAEIKDPGLFQRLVSALFIADQGHSFQVVDDSGGDRGNDGYDPQRGILYAIYCPEKPLNGARSLAKARGDLAKARQLLSDPGYKFSDWVFVTPIPLRETVQATIRADAQAAGLTASFMSAAHLEAIFLRHPELRDVFPELNYPRVEKALQEISQKLDELSSGTIVDVAATAPAPPDAAAAGTFIQPPLDDAPSLLFGFSSPRLADIQQRLFDGIASALYELERFKLEASTPRDWIAAALVEIEFEGEQLHFERVRDLGSEAATRAARFGFRAEAAAFMAREAHARTMLLSSHRMEFNGRLAFSARSGAVLVSVKEAKAHDAMRFAETTKINDLLRTAHELASETRNLQATLQVALFSGMSATHRALPEKLLLGVLDGSDVAEGIKQSKRQMMAAYSLAISAASALGSQQLLALVYHDFANDLLIFDDKPRALSHASYAMTLAQAAEDQHQISKTKRLLELIHK